MNDTVESKQQDQTAWLRPASTDFSHLESRTRLLLAISDAESMGFHATQQSLVGLLQALELAHTS